MNANRGGLLLALLFCSLLTVTSLSLAGYVTFYVDGVAGTDQTYCGTQAKPCKTIAYTVNNKAQQNNNSIINLAPGTYNTNTFNDIITIDKKNVSLVGAGNASTIIVGNNSTPAIIANGPAFVQLANLSIRNGNPGIYGDNVSVTLNDVVVQNNSGGITLQSNSSLKVLGGSISSNSMQGVVVGQNSSANIYNSSITQNNGNGLTFNSGSSGGISNTTISNNAYAGLFVVDNSQASIAGSTVTGNAQFGIHVTTHSSLRVAGGNQITNNGGSGGGPGILIVQNSQATIQRNGNNSPDSIAQNAANGVSLGDQSSLLMVDGNVANNGGNGVDVSNNSMANILPNASITGNTGWGLNCGGDSIYAGISGSFTGNGAGQVNCSNTSTPPAPVNTSAVCVDGGDRGGNFVFDTYCSCSGGEQKTITRVKSECTVTSSTGSCSAHSSYGLMAGEPSLIGTGECCVCAP